MQTEKPCEQCGETYPAQRPRSRFCSPKCRVAYNKRHKNGAPAHQFKPEPPAHEAIEAALADPRRGLAAIAADPLQPAAARVSAYKALAAAPKAEQTREEKTMSLLDQRTQEILARRVN